MKFAAIRTKVKSKLKRNSGTLGDGDIKLIMKLKKSNNIASIEH
jgi:hypothetical protein